MSLPFLPCFSSLFLLLVIFHIPTCNAEKPLSVSCNNTYNGATSAANYSVNSAFHTNLKILLPSLSSNVYRTQGFYNTSIGDGVDKVYGLVLCRGDARPDMCRNCTDLAIDALLSQCQSRSSIIWYDLCQVQYSDINFFDILIDKVWWFGVHSELKMDESEVEPFNNSRDQLMRDLAKKTPYEPCLFATGEQNYSLSNNVYGLMQCKRVIHAADCHMCLNEAVKKIPDYCDSMIGGRVVSEVCSLRFENSSFIRSDSRCGPGPKKKSPVIIVLLILAAVVGMILFAIVAVYLVKLLLKKQRE